MFHIIYLSSEARKLTEKDLDELLRESREKNKRLGVTGMLFYRDGFFLQVIEGEEATIRPLYGKIYSDRRHRVLKTLFSEEITARKFQNWSMAFRDLSTERRLTIPDGYGDLKNRAGSEEQVEAFSKKARVFLEAAAAG
jgi:hypothetical protein